MIRLLTISVDLHVQREIATTAVRPVTVVEYRRAVKRKTRGDEDEVNDYGLAVCIFPLFIAVINHAIQHTSTNMSMELGADYENEVSKILLGFTR